ncbi:hypothetical protein SAMN05428952_1003109 [Nitrosomonas sp. Nm132]|nr:hypothetical protein SAMN05428952_1003109 [Nitrosomonas sp. Nm132]
MSGSDLHRSWEISAMPGAVTQSGGTGKVRDRNPVIHVAEKSDTSILPRKPPNNGKPAEVEEGRGVAKGNAGEAPAGRTQNRGSALTGLERIRQAAGKDRRMKFITLLHHITPSLLVESFHDLKRNAAAGVDGVTWRGGYAERLYARVHGLHRKIHAGTYRAQASRRVFIPKADGRLRPLGIVRRWPNGRRRCAQMK